MDFFTAQDKARGRSKHLVIYFILAVMAIILAVYAVVLGVFYSGVSGAGVTGSMPWWNPAVLVWVAVLVGGVIGAASWVKIAELRSGGGAVARSLGGRKVDPDTQDPLERRYYNVVEEMAIASGCPVPEVYVLPHESGINGFAAGFSPRDAAIAVTRGCLERLSRDELQGVVAHEFSHILNGDMRLNIKLMGVLFGILVIAFFGRLLLHSMRFSGGSQRSNRDGGGAAVAIFVLGLAIMLIGYIGVFFGRLIQSAVSRQREFLADAAAVQFTRNPAGLSGALKRIGGTSQHGRIANAHAEDAAHLFFVNGLRGGFGSLFATHPPLERRIRSLEPDWDGKYLTEPAPPPSKSEGKRPPPVKSTPGLPPVLPLRAAAVAGMVGQTTAAQVGRAQALRQGIPVRLTEAIHRTLSARAVVFGLLLDEDPALRHRQIAFLRQDAGDELAAEVEALHPSVMDVGLENRLVLLEMAFPALLNLDEPGYRTFHQRVQKLVTFDHQTTLFEFAVLRLVRQRLGARFENRSADHAAVDNPSHLRPAARLVFAAIATAAAEDVQEARRNFEKTVGGSACFKGLIWTPFDLASLDPLNVALDQLATASYRIKKDVITTAAGLIAYNGQVSVGEGELLRVLCTSLDCPLPPLGSPA